VLEKGEWKMVNPGNDNAEMANARANVYGLLADVYRGEPSEAFLKNLRAPEFSGALNALDLSLDELFEDASLSELVEVLALEYARLFIGPGSHISPHESMHVTARFGEPNSLWGAATVAAKKFIEATGLEISESFGGMPDHISAEFEFMQKMAVKEAQAWSDGDKELGGNIQNIEKRFFEDHLSQWVANFSTKVVDNSNSPFYRQFAEVTIEFIAFAAEALNGGHDEAKPIH